MDVFNKSPSMQLRSFVLWIAGKTITHFGLFEEQLVLDRMGWGKLIGRYLSNAQYIHV